MPRICVRRNAPCVPDLSTQPGWFCTWGPHTSKSSSLVRVSYPDTHGYGTHYLRRLDPDPHQSEKLKSRVVERLNAHGNVEAHNRAVEGL